MPWPSCLFAGEMLIASGTPYLSTARWILMPLIFLPPSKPRPKQVGAERQERLSMMTAPGTGLSPQCQHEPNRDPPSASNFDPARSVVGRASNPVALTKAAAPTVGLGQ